MAVFDGADSLSQKIREMVEQLLLSDRLSDTEKSLILSKALECLAKSAEAPRS